MQANSLRYQLIKRLLWPLVLLQLAGSIFAYLFALHVAMKAYDIGLLNDALGLSKQVEMQQGKMNINLPMAVHQMLQANSEDHETYAAWDAAGQLFSGSPKLAFPQKLPAKGSHVFQDIVLDGEKNRAVVLHGKAGEKDYFIAVSQTMHGRNRLTDNIVASILIPEALLVLVSLAVIFWGVRKGLSPVMLLRDKIASRSFANLQPIEEPSTPAELVPIIHGTNELLANLATAFAGHRRFIADAAHQLRTPLASLSSQIEVALNTPNKDTDKLLHQLLATARRTTHLANQLLSLARLEHTEQSMYEVEMVELKEIFLDAAADIVTLAARKKVELDFNLQPCQIEGNRLMLRELLANLLDNAVRYTPPGGKVAVSLQANAQDILLTVEDNGIGVPTEDLAKLGTPFLRLASPQSEGCGLGLAIVREIARLHKADVHFSQGAEGHGLRVSINFPA